MDELRGKVAFITGGANGIGLAMARAFLAQGMKVAIADIDDDALESAAATIPAPGTVLLPMRLDVTDRYLWSIAADRVEAALGPVQLLCCNAGVAGSQEPLDEVGVGSWQWTFDVNVNGTLYGLKTFLPRLRSAGLPGHILITSSLRSIYPQAEFASSAASKSALVAIAEALRRELDGSRIDVSLLLPGPVNTRFIANTVRYSRRVGVRVRIDPDFEQELHQGMPPEDVAAAAVEAVRGRRFWVFTDDAARQSFESRSREILGALDEAAEMAADGHELAADFPHPGLPPHRGRR